MTNEEKRNIYNNIQNLYNMDFTSWQEVLAMMYNLISDVNQKLEKIETEIESINEQLDNNKRWLYE